MDWDRDIRDEKSWYNREVRLFQSDFSWDWGRWEKECEWISEGKYQRFYNELSKDILT